MFYNNNIWISSTTDYQNPQYLLLKMANRHGLIAGATGTGKTTTLKVLAESFSAAGVPVFTADIKGDLTNSCLPGDDSEDMQRRIANFGLADKGFSFKGFPITYWDVFGKYGHPVRATISEMGPILLSNILGLSDAQEGILNIAFNVADDNNLLLIDLKDLRSMLQYVSDHSDELITKYGNITKQSVGAIVRSLVELENMGAEQFFGEPDLDMNDWLRCDASGKGYINCLECSELFQRPKLYATFMLWMLSELYETLPEVGDLDKPKMVFFFDEAHLLFDDAPKALVDKIVQVVRLVRSKGVGVYFVTQSPIDLPPAVLEQLGNRIQHALHAYTPAEIKKLKEACDTFRANDDFKTEDVITQMGVGEALCTFFDENGVPGVVQRTYILPPESKFGSLDFATLAHLINTDEFASKYNEIIDRQSAYEDLQDIVAKQIEEQQRIKAEEEEAKRLAEEEKKKEKEKLAKEKAEAKEKEKKKNFIVSLGKSAIRTTTNSLARGILGNLKKLF